MKARILLIVTCFGVSIWAQVEEVEYIAAGDSWRYMKGTEAPPSSWKSISFNDSSWLSGPTGIGYGDGDDATELTDMRGNYVSVFMRRKFRVAEPAAVTALTLEVVYDDGFAAYLNGSEVARVNLADGAAFDATASSAIEPTSITIDLSSRLSLLEKEENVLAIEVHNGTPSSSDLSMIPVLSGRVLSNVVRFIRGDANEDGSVNVSDATFLLAYLFEDGPASRCPDTEDVNDDGRLNLIDAIYLLADLFVSGPPIPEPTQCGLDPTWEDEDPRLADCEYNPCAG